MNRMIGHWTKAYGDKLQCGRAVELPTGKTLHFVKDCYYVNAPEGQVTILGFEDKGTTGQIFDDASEKYVIGMIPKDYFAEAVPAPEETEKAINEAAAAGNIEFCDEDHHD